MAENKNDLQAIVAGYDDRKLAAMISNRSNYFPALIAACEAELSRRTAAGTLSPGTAEAAQTPAGDGTTSGGPADGTAGFGTAAGHKGDITFTESLVQSFSDGGPLMLLAMSTGLLILGEILAYSDVLGYMPSFVLNMLFNIMLCGAIGFCAYKLVPNQWVKILLFIFCGSDLLQVLSYYVPNILIWNSNSDFAFWWWDIYSRGLILKILSLVVMTGAAVLSRNLYARIGCGIVVLVGSWRIYRLMTWFETDYGMGALFTFIFTLLLTAAGYILLFAGANQERVNRGLSR